MNDWQIWKQTAENKRSADKQAVRERIEKAPNPKRKVTADELRKFQKLRGISMQTGTGGKRFMSQYADMNADTEISERQARFIEILWYKYRRQLGHNDPKPEYYESSR